MSDTDSTAYDWNSDDEPPQEAVGEQRTVTSDKLVKKSVLVRGIGYNRPGRSDKVLIQIGPNETELGAEKWVRLGKGKLACAIEIAIRQMREKEMSSVSYPEDSVYGEMRPPIFNKSKRYMPIAPDVEGDNLLERHCVHTCIRLIEFKSLRRLTDDGNIIKEVVVYGRRGRRPADDDFVSYDVLDENLNIIESVERVKIHDLPNETYRGLRSMQLGEVAILRIDDERDIYIRLKDFCRLNITDGLRKLELTPSPEDLMRTRGDVDGMHVLMAISIVAGDEVGFDIKWSEPHFYSFFTSMGTIPSAIERCVQTMALLEDSCFELESIGKPLFKTTPPEVPPPLKNLDSWSELRDFALPIWNGTGKVASSKPPPTDWVNSGEPCLFPEIPAGRRLVRIWLIGLRPPMETYAMDDEARAQYIVCARKVANAYVEEKMYAEAQVAYDRALDALRFEVAELFEVRAPKNVIRALPKNDPPTPQQVNQYVILHCNLAFCAAQRENYQQAKDAADSALRHDTNCLKALFRRAVAYEGMGDWSQALSDFGRLLTLAPKDPLVHKAITRLQNAMDVQEDKDKDMCKKMF
eukprot:GEMP01038516.1.p1 GENE.GEMP01038516.1~~GEMP01038516.1.p1  ORF type:complete len:580 (+),score=117.25 GEMP01038516.1:64-1803(+)